MCWMIMEFEFIYSIFLYLVLLKMRSLVKELDYVVIVLLVKVRY